MDYLRENGLKLFVVVVILILLSPTALPQPFIQPLNQLKTALSFGRIEQAIMSLTELREFEPSTQAMHGTEFQLALQQGEYADAQSHLEVLQSMGIHSTTISCGALQLELVRNPDHPAEALQSALARCPDAEDALHELAHTQFDNGEFEKAVPLLENLIVFGTQTDADMVMLALYEAAVDPIGAQVLLRQAQNIQSQDGQLALALLLMIQDYRDEEPAAFLSARIGQTFMRENRWHLAHKAFELAVDQDPAYARAWGYLGVVKDQLEMDGGPEFDKAVRLSTDDALLLILQATHFNRSDQPELALPILEQAAILDPENPAIATELGQTFLLLGDMEAAGAAFKQATLLAPDEASFWTLLADFSLNYEIDIDSLAIPALRNALMLEPDSSHAWRSLGYAYHLQGNYRLAERTLHKAIELAPDDPITHYYLGLLYQENGLTDQAIAAWSVAKRISPDHPYAILAQRAMESLGTYP